MWISLLLVQWIYKEETCLDVQFSIWIINHGH